MAPPPKPKRRTPAATAATAAKNKAAAGSKTSGETDADYAKEEPIRVVSKTYGLETYDKHAVTEYADGANDYYVIQFYVTGAVWDGGYLATLSEDGYTLKWSRPIEGLLFRMEHLKSIMGDDYSPSHVRVRAFDNVTQTMFKDKVEPDANGLYWGKPQEIHLKEKCTGIVDTDPTDYRAPPKVDPVNYRGRKNYQFHTIITCKVQIAERRKTATIKKKKTTVDMFDVPSSQGTSPSPGVQRGRNRDWGGSHRGESEHKVVEEEEEEGDDDDERFSGDDDYDEDGRGGGYGSDGGGKRKWGN
jgi:hypothetical protein